MKISERKEPSFNVPPRQKKLISIQFRHHNTLMYLLYDDGTMYCGDPDKNVGFTEIKGAE